MYFLLHHPTGALVLTAEDRDQVVSWTRRQLGQGAKAASVLNLEECHPLHCIEHSGPGIHQAQNGGCEAQLSFMADAVQRVNGFGREIMEIQEWYHTTEVGGRSSSLH